MAKPQQMASLNLSYIIQYTILVNQSIRSSHFRYDHMASIAVNGEWVSFSFHLADATKPVVGLQNVDGSQTTSQNMCEKRT